MNDVIFKIILMISTYIILGCIIYIVTSRETKEISDTKLMFCLMSGIVFRPVIRACIYLDEKKLFEEGLNKYFKEVEQEENRKLTKEEKKEIREVMKILVEEGERVE